MKKEIVLTFLLIVMISSFASAEMIINQQPNKVYNLGDSVTLPVTVKTITGTSGIFSMDLLCGTKQINFYKNGVNLLPGQEKTMDASLVLTKEILGENVGTCKIKGILGAEYFLTNEFKISNLITVVPNTEQNEFEPGQSILIYGDATKENGQPSNGFIDLEIVLANASGENILQKGTVNNGMFSMNISLPEKMKAGKYLVKLNAYEASFDNTLTNKGFVNYNIQIKQIPTSLEIVLKDTQVEPGKSVEVKTILHDQTGESIESSSIITIRKDTGEIPEEGGPIEKKTQDYLKLPIVYNEPPTNWTVEAVSNGLTAESSFNILENQEIKVELVNQTLHITNVGNVPYNGTINIRIGNISKEFTLFLPVDGNNKYELKTEHADEYEVELMDEQRESLFKENVFLPESRVSGSTGFAIRDFSELNKDFYLRPLFWIFIAILLAAIIFVLIRRHKKKKHISTPKKSLFKRKLKIKSQPKTNAAWENRAIPLSKESKLKTNNKANLSLSIKGNKQEVSVVNISARNLAELQAKKANTEEPLQKIVNLAESRKAFVYENQNNLTFILAPSKTRTFKNETTALEIAQDAKEILSGYNRIAKHKIDFGISIEYGSIVEKTENGIMQFMTLGTLMNNTKKISSASEGEVLLGENIKNKLTNVRTEKQDNGKVIFYKIKDIKYYDEGHSRYMQSFLNKKTEGKSEGTKYNTLPTQDKTQKTNQDTEKNPDPKSLIKGFY